MTSLINLENQIIFVGKSKRFPIEGWLHPCYFCDIIGDDFVNYLVYRIYACKDCQKIAYPKLQIFKQSLDICTIKLKHILDNIKEQISKNTWFVYLQKDIFSQPDVISQSGMISQNTSDSDVQLQKDIFSQSSRIRSQNTSDSDVLHNKCIIQ